MINPTPAFHVSGRHEKARSVTRVESTPISRPARAVVCEIIRGLPCVAASSIPLRQSSTLVHPRDSMTHQISVSAPDVGPALKDLLSGRPVAHRRAGRALAFMASRARKPHVSLDLMSAARPDSLRNLGRAEPPGLRQIGQCRSRSNFHLHVRSHRRRHPPRPLKPK